MYLKSKENDNNQIVVTQTYSMYLFLMFVVVILILLLIKFSIPSGNEQRGGGKKGFMVETSFLLGIIVVFMILSRFLRPYIE